MAESLVPSWLEPLLTAPFFTTCRSHGESTRSERNMFCLDCPSSTAFCFYCRSSFHSGHRTIQIRRSSYHDVVRVAEIQKVLDISGVQTYVINSARVLFLNERPQPKTTHPAGGASVSGNMTAGGGGHHTCETCSRTLLDPFRFCSLGCKLEGIKRNGNACFVVDEGDEEEEHEQDVVGITGKKATGAEITGGEEKRRRWRRRVRSTAVVGDSTGAAGVDESNGQDMCSSPPSSTSLGVTTSSSNNNRRRKGIPHRSPLASS